ncbi:hypothetical protein OA88_20500 [Flavobacterium sp. JRM]|nr:hypothetical protein OA88_20500 [Flavobacterium sp. JRM]
MLKIKLESHRGYEGKNLKNLNESLLLLESVLNGQNFKDTVLKFESDKTEGGTFHFITYTKWRSRRTDLPIYSNQEIYDKVMKGNETDGSDCFIVYNLTLERGSGGSTVGYTENNGNIHTYTSDFLEMTSGEFAAHLFHEFTHTIDFEHSPSNKNDSLRDCYSVPYALGNFVEIITTGSCSYKCKY